MIINNTEELFSVLNRKDDNSQSITFSDDFLNSITFRIQIEGKTLDNIDINGHVTIDLLNICNAMQNLIYSIYANIVKNKNDARSLSDEEKQKLTLIFKVINGSTEERIENLKEILHFFNNMDTKKAIILIGLIVFVAGGYFYTKTNDSDNELKKNLLINQNIENAINSYKEITITALNSSKLDIQKAKIGNIILDKKQIQEHYNDINNNDNDIQELIHYKLIVKKLYKKGNRKMATLSNDNIEIDVSFTKDLFENNEDLFIQSFTKEKYFDSEILIEKSTNGTIKKATLIKIII